MRRIRIAVCFIFVAACIIFGIYIVKTRMVEDHKPPVITCEEDTISVSVAAEDAELLAGVTAKDDKDGDITKSVRISSMSHFIEEGKRTVTYAVFDKANQAATVQRTLVYTDYVSPKIYLKKPLRYSLKDLNSVTLTENMAASDCLDGDLTKQIHTTWTDGGYAYEPGVYSVTVQVSNSAGDVCAVPVEVDVTDNMDRAEVNKSYPMLSEYIVYTTVGNALDLNSYLTGIVRGNAEYTFERDAEYLQISREAVVIQSSVDYTIPGVYQVQYIYTDPAGVPAVTKMFVVVEE